MSFLYDNNSKFLILFKHNTFYDKPSPTCKKGFCLNQNSYSIKSFMSYVGRISRFSSLGSLRGSMTVEASIVLPLFLFFFLQIAGFIEMLRLHSNLEYGLWNTGKTLMLYGAVEEVAESIPDVAVSYVYVKNALRKTLGTEYLDGSPLRYGSDGLNFLETEILNDSDEVKLVLTYQVKPAISILPFPYARMANIFYGRAWTGYDVASADSTSKVAYITKYGEVWHSTPDCSHLKLSIQKVTAGEVNSYKNRWGEGYVKCSICVSGATPEVLYITQDGDCFHYKESCAGLTRNVITIAWEEREKYRACSRCVGG